MFRFPRRRIAASLLATEQRYLSALAAHLPAPGVTAALRIYRTKIEPGKRSPGRVPALPAQRAPVELTSEVPRDETGRSNLPLRLQASRAKPALRVIDWGELHVADPALALSFVFSFLAQRSRSAFWAIYGEVDPHTVARARFRALSYELILLDYGHEIADAALAHAGRTALAFALDQ